MSATGIKVLAGHTSAETAYVIADYPYGFRLRCKLRAWIETTKHGQRVVTQTTNPKKPGEVWNKPKASTYSEVRVLYIDADGKLANAGASHYDDEPKLDAFIATYGPALGGAYEVKALLGLRALARASKRIKYDVVEGRTETVEERAARRVREVRYVSAVIADETRKLAAEAVLAPVEKG